MRINTDKFENVATYNCKIFFFRHLQKIDSAEILTDIRPTPSQILEKEVPSGLQSHLVADNISKVQSVFRVNCSTTTAPLKITADNFVSNFMMLLESVRFD